MTLSFILIGAVGLLGSLCVYKKIRTLRLVAILAMAASAAFIYFGVRPDALHSLTIPVRMRLAMGIITFSILYVTLEAVRRTSLKERYALLWVGTSGICFMLAIHPDLIEILARITGMHYLTAIVLIVFTFLLLVIFHFSLVLSRNEDDRRRLAQTVAILENRIDQLEKEPGDSEKSA